jgi:two-component system, sensor histidine kinase and response regulator
MPFVQAFIRVAHGLDLATPSARWPPRSLVPPTSKPHIILSSDGSCRTVDHPRTILVVDDNQDNLTILRTFLEARGYDVAEAQDGRSALAKLEEVKPELVLLDVMMPGMDGWQVCRTIKNHPVFCDTRVMMVTAKGGYEDKFEGMRSGADDYVVKPYDLKELAQKVERNLEARERDA